MCFDLWKTHISEKLYLRTKKTVRNLVLFENLYSTPEFTLQTHQKYEFMK